MAIIQSHNLDTRQSQPLTYSPANSPPISPHLSSPTIPIEISLPVSESELTLAPPSRRSSLAELNAMNEDPALQSSLVLELVDDEIKIERWLDGSTSTVSAFGSILGFDDLVEKAATPVSRLSPIRSMRPSSQRRGSKPDNFAAGSGGNGEGKGEQFIGAAF